jgi:hypothetical protein
LNSENGGSTSTVTSVSAYKTTRANTQEAKILIITAVKVTKPTLKCTLKEQDTTPRTGFNWFKISLYNDYFEKRYEHSNSNVGEFL